MIQYFAEHLWQLWLIISFICLILELTNGDFFIFCFAVGGIGGLAASLLSDTFWVQVVAFAAISLLSIFFVRPVILKYFHKPGRKSNAEALIGRTGKVEETIPANGYGYVKIDGDSWKAKSKDGSPLDRGTNVIVIGMESIIITVEKVE